MSLQQALTIRCNPQEFAFLADLADAQGTSANQVVRLIVQQAMADGRDANRLSALENRVLEAIKKIPSETADLLTRE